MQFYIEWLKQQVSLPVIVKGIMSAEDAHDAVNAGADALVVSNHGGRILDFNRAALEVLPEVVAAVGAPSSLATVKQADDPSKELAVKFERLIQTEQGWFAIDPVEVGPRLKRQR